MMAFSGQYAAARLEKLDHSPLFRGHSFPLAKEIAGYLGYAPDFVPPTYLTFARVYERIPSLNANTRAAYTPVLNRDVDNFRGYHMNANISRFDGDRIRIDYVIGTLAALREQRREGDSPCYCFVVELLSTPEDFDFFARWRATYGDAWPHTLNGDRAHYHHMLLGAFQVHWRYADVWHAARERQRTRVIQYNNA